MVQFAAGFQRDPSDVPYFSSGVTIPAPNSRAQQAVVHRLFVDNRDRHNYPASSPFDFQVYLGNDPRASAGVQGYENVTSVELKAVALPKVANERYVIMSVAELNDNMLESTTPAAHNAFAIIYFDSDALAAGAIKPLKGADFYQKQLVFKPPLARLNRLSVSFLKHDGTVVTTGDTGGVDHVSVLLEVTARAGYTG